MSKSADNRQEKHAQTAMRPIIGLTEDLPKVVLEGLVLEAIYKHRYLRDIAQHRHTESSNSGADARSCEAARMAYVRAMIDVHAHQTVLSTLIDVLGYVPQTGKG